MGRKKHKPEEIVGKPRQVDVPSSPSSLPLAGDLRLDHVPDHSRDVVPAELCDLPDAGRRGDVDLGEVIADHVDTDEDQPALFQLRPEPRANLLVAVGEGGWLRSCRRHADWSASRLPPARD